MVRNQGYFVCGSNVSPITMTSQCTEDFFEAEGRIVNKEMGKEVCMVLEIQIWSPNTAKAILGNVSILNGGVTESIYHSEMCSEYT